MIHSSSKKKLSVVFWILTGLFGLTPLKAKAFNVFVEPFASYTVSGEFERSLEQGNESGKLKGFAMGGRGGFSRLGVLYGLEVMRATWTEEIKKRSIAESPKDNNNENNEKQNAEDLKESPSSQLKKERDAHFVALSYFFGYSFPNIFDAWMSSILFVETEDGNKAKIKDKPGFRLGAAFTGLPYVNLGAEYFQYDFDDSDRSGTTLFVSATFP